jgi:hypothetical protein
LSLLGESGELGSFLEGWAGAAFEASRDLVDPDSLAGFPDLLAGEATAGLGLEELGGAGCSMKAGRASKRGARKSSPRGISSSSGGPMVGGMVDLRVGGELCQAVRNAGKTPVVMLNSTGDY